MSDGMPFAYLTQSSNARNDNDSLVYSQIQPSWSSATSSSTLGQPLVQFHMPHFMHNGPPTLAHGGGAEVIPAAVFNSINQNTYPSWTSPSYPKVQLPEKKLPQSDIPNTEIPSSLNVSLYSATGFDVLAVLSRVFTRPNPQVTLGPVDFTSSFCVVDPKRFDAPVIYCSPSFCSLTGYDEPEIIGRNCRFLQSPPSAGPLERGSRRLLTDQTQVSFLAKSIAAGLECQLSLTNYRKDGTPFNNLITVIPLHEEVGNPDSEIVYYVGFQVDLTAQPHSIMERLSTGRYLLEDPLLKSHTSVSMNTKERRVPIPPNVISNDLQRLLSDADFLLPVSPSSVQEANSEVSHPLSSILLSTLPDFIHVLSLKGSFLYCSPVVNTVLGWSATELIGKSLADICHPADLVGVLRELKEGATGAGANSDDATSTTHKSRPICLLFRALTKSPSTVQAASQNEGHPGQYVWLECRGRLYSEPGKGRKAIMLSGRARAMWSIDWSDVNQLGIMVTTSTPSLGKRKRASENDQGSSKHVQHRQDAWGLLSSVGTCLAVDEGARTVIGLESSDMIGTSLADILLKSRPDATATSVKTALRKLSSAPLAGAIEQIAGKVARRDGSIVPVILNIFSASMSPTLGLYSVDHAPFVFQLRLDCGEPARHVLSEGQVFAPLLASPQPAMSFNSSWQYEIQQVRYENARLAEEVEKLEDALMSVIELPPAEMNTMGPPDMDTSVQGFEDGGTYAAEGQSGMPFNIRPLPPQPRARSDASRHGAISGAGSASVSAENHSRYGNGPPSALNASRTLFSTNFSLSSPLGEVASQASTTSPVFAPSLFSSGFLSGSSRPRITTPQALNLTDTSQDWRSAHVGCPCAVSRSGAQPIRDTPT